MTEEITPVPTGISNPPAEEVKVETPEVPETPETPEEKVETPEVPAETPAAPAQPEQTDTLAKQNEELKRGVERRNEQLESAVEIQADLVSTNPDLIHQIATKDPVLANRVIQKVWGNEGIKSYKQLVERAKLEEIKEENPDLYETKKELAEVRARQEEIFERESKAAKEKFFSTKKILVNDYDPNYKRVMEALEYVNPQLVKDDYAQALEVAYRNAFFETPLIPKQPTPTLEANGGTPPPPLPPQTPQVSEQSAWLAEALNKKRGYKIKL